MHLQKALEKPSRKAIRSGRDRTKVNEKVKLQMINLAKNVQERPRRAFYKWLYAPKPNPLVNELKGQKLRNALEKIPRRTLKDATDRILGEGDKVNGAIRRMLL